MGGTRKVESWNALLFTTHFITKNLGKIQLDNAISPAVVAAVAAAGYDSDSDLEQQQQTASTRSRQKKFLKNFKQLPQEEVVLQRYSCALVSDILLQGHLYITENYFAFHSNVFGYVTRVSINTIRGGQLEPVCCKKQQKKFLTSCLFVE